MKKYTFLFRTLFFIFSLIAAVWMVMQIEKLKPSDFGKHKSIFEMPSKEERNKTKLIKVKTLMTLYKEGKVPLSKLEQEINKVICE